MSDKVVDLVDANDVVEEEDVVVVVEAGGRVKPGGSGSSTGVDDETATHASSEGDGSNNSNHLDPYATSTCKTTDHSLSRLAFAGYVLFVVLIALATFLLLFFFCGAKRDDDSRVNSLSASETVNDGSMSKYTRMSLLQTKLAELYSDGSQEHQQEQQGVMVDPQDGEDVVNTSSSSTTSSPPPLHVYSSPQYKAARWMAHDDEITISMLKQEDDIETVNELELFQRYAMVVLHFATGGKACGRSGDGSNGGGGNGYHNRLLGYYGGGSDHKDKSWTNQYGFKSSLSVCDWNDPITQQGVFCDDNGLIQKLILANNNLRGVLPYEELQELNHHLIHIDLQDNPKLVVNQFPTHMETLRFSRTQVTHEAFLDDELEGFIQESVGTLQVLELSGTGLYGSLPKGLGKLGVLQVLDLSCNGFTGTIPEQYSFLLPTLQELYLHSNLLTGNFNAVVCTDDETTTALMVSEQRDTTLRAITSTTLSSLSADCSTEVICDCCTECDTICPG